MVLDSKVIVFVLVFRRKNKSSKFVRSFHFFRETGTDVGIQDLCSSSLTIVLLSPDMPLQFQLDIAKEIIQVS